MSCREGLTIPRNGTPPPPTQQCEAWHSGMFVQCGTMQGMDDANSTHGAQALVPDRQADPPAGQEHPALARLRDRLADQQKPEITSYDRMHHRHNRH